MQKEPWSYKNTCPASNKKGNTKTKKFPISTNPRASSFDADQNAYTLQG